MTAYSELDISRGEPNLLQRGITAISNAMRLRAAENKYLGPAPLDPEKYNFRSAIQSTDAMLGDKHLQIVRHASNSKLVKSLERLHNAGIADPDSIYRFIFQQENARPNEQTVELGVAIQNLLSLFQSTDGTQPNLLQQFLHECSQDGALLDIQPQTNAQVPPYLRAGLLHTVYKAVQTLGDTTIEQPHSYKGDNINTISTKVVRKAFNIMSASTKISKDIAKGFSPKKPNIKIPLVISGGAVILAACAPSGEQNPALVTQFVEQVDATKSPTPLATPKKPTETSTPEPEKPKPSDTPTATSTPEMQGTPLPDAPLITNAPTDPIGFSEGTIPASETKLVEIAANNEIGLRAQYTRLYPNDKAPWKALSFTNVSMDPDHPQVVTIFQRLITAEVQGVTVTYWEYAWASNGETNVFNSRPDVWDFGTPGYNRIRIPISYSVKMGFVENDKGNYPRLKVTNTIGDSWFFNQSSAAATNEVNVFNPNDTRSWIKINKPIVAQQPQNQLSEDPNPGRRLPEAEPEEVAAEIKVTPDAAPTPVEPSYAPIPPMLEATTCNNPLPAYTGTPENLALFDTLFKRMLEGNYSPKVGPQADAINNWPSGIFQGWTFRKIIQSDLGPERTGAYIRGCGTLPDNTPIIIGTIKIDDNSPNQLKFAIYDEIRGPHNYELLQFGNARFLEVAKNHGGFIVDIIIDDPGKPEANMSAKEKKAYRMWKKNEASGANAAMRKLMNGGYAKLTPAEQALVNSSIFPTIQITFSYPPDKK